jgi:hypothetical protein
MAYIIVNHQSLRKNRKTQLISLRWRRILDSRVYVDSKVVEALDQSLMRRVPGQRGLWARSQFGDGKFVFAIFHTRDEPGPLCSMAIALHEIRVVSVALFEIEGHTKESLAEVAIVRGRGKQGLHPLVKPAAAGRADPVQLGRRATKETSHKPVWVRLLFASVAFAVGRVCWAVRGFVVAPLSKVYASQLSRMVSIEAVVGLLRRGLDFYFVKRCGRHILRNMEVETVS